MQNRTNRGLLFGARATAGGDLPSAGASGESDALEQDNQRAIEALRGSAGSMKDIAIHIDADVADHNRLLDRMDKRFDSANSLLAQTSHLLHQLVADRSSSRMCLLVAAFFAALALAYYLLRH
ncbi:Bet1 [Chondrus crispus]|uniref:Bet1 n=1 Tax=Chondrus crispus TaxID=2769 RepID=R7QR51_CHOCR|nr:Bet1 [Chondrus crispus]CDF40957.1 Bet1 [Chondrus crispus]|eukprot:XP_005711251.1 Bet1 [Chondrus crispus]